MLGNVELRFVTPSDESELHKYKKDFLFLNHFSPMGLSEDELWDILGATLPHNTLVYANGVLIGCFTMDVYSKSVELHGIVRPDIGQIVPYANRVKVFIFKTILETIFDRMGRDKVVIKGSAKHKGIRGFALMWGFNRLQNPDKGRTVWVLTKERFKDRVNGSQENPKGQAVHSHIGI